MKRTLTLILGVALLGIFTAVVMASQGGDDPVAAGTTTGETTERTTTTDTATDRTRTGDDANVDISGPCDEAEHASDRAARAPRATTAATATTGPPTPSRLPPRRGRP